jgi:hypothetical protein
MSSDVARFVTALAFTNNCTVCEGVEDHDITSVALLYPTPLNLIGVGRHQQFWGKSPSANLSQALYVSNSSSIAKKHDPGSDALASGACNSGSGPVRLLVGIFSTESDKSLSLRSRISSLFKLWNDDRICSFSGFQTLPTHQRKRSRCQFIYTFVIGGDHPGAPAENVGNDRPMLFNRTSSNESDPTSMTYLNIRENMEDGKSQSWLKYAAHMAEIYGFTYVGKMHEDSILKRKTLFEFISARLPPPPYNQGLLAGVMAAKSGWGSTILRHGEMPDFHGFFDRHANNPEHIQAYKDFDGEHVFPGGTCASRRCSNLFFSFLNTGLMHAIAFHFVFIHSARGNVHHESRFGKVCC